MDMLRFITCGSVDDGKSTLMGRMLYDAKMVFDDQVKAVESESKRYGTTGKNIDLALIVDGLQSEREQGITIDVAYRFFSTQNRKFIMADTPGHEEYTRNMITGASTADVAIILIDARKGILTQTRRHSFIVNLMDIKHIIVAINKMDLVGYSKEIFDDIQKCYEELAKELGMGERHYIPLSALDGDNVVKRSENTPYYKDKTLLNLLDTIDVSKKQKCEHFRFPVQYVNRPNLDFRGFCGTITSGTLCVGDDITILPSRKVTKVKSIIDAGDISETNKSSTCRKAFSPMAITITTEDEVGISRGDMIVHTKNLPKVSSSFKVMLIWMDDEPMQASKHYDIKGSAFMTSGVVKKINHKIDIDTYKIKEVKKLELNDIASCEIQLNQPVAVETYKDNHLTGSFILIDKITNNTVGAGVVVDINLQNQTKQFMSANNVTKHIHSLKKSQRTSIKKQKTAVLWLTGLSGSGKSSIANALELKLYDLNKHTYLLDGDNLREGLNTDLGFSDEDRTENIRRVAELSKLFVDAGLIVICAFISPFKKDREFARSLLDEGEFIEIHIDTPMNICQSRDPKGLYKMAKNLEIDKFTGLKSIYEKPENAEIVVQTQNNSIEQCANTIVEYLQKNLIC